MATQDLTVNFRVNDQGTASLEKIKNSVSGIQRAVDTINVAALVNLGEKALQAGQRLFEFAEMGAKVQAIGESFSIMSKSAGIAGDALIEKLKKVTNATIDDSDLMRKANRMIVEDFSATQITYVAEAARTAARIMGTDVSSAYDQITDAVVNLRQRGLKTAGFVIDLNDAYAKHAAKIKTTANELSDYGKQMALVEALHEKDIEIRKRMGPLLDTEYEKMQKQKAIWKEFAENIAKAASEAWSLASALVSIATKKIAGTTPPAAWGGEEVNAVRARQMVQEELMFAGGIGGPTGKKPSETKVDPFVLLYGMKEDELKNRLSISKLLYAAWLEDWTHDSEMITADINAWWAGVQTTIKETAPVFAKEGPWTEMELTEAEYNYYKKTAEIAAQARQEWVATYAETPNHIRDVLRMESTWQELGNSINSVWAENVTGILKGTTTMGEAFKNMATGMADVFISSITKMIANYILFQNVQGVYKSGMGAIGWVGALLGAQEGGIFNQPTVRMIGEAGPEAVVPLKGGKIPVEGGKGNPTYIEYNSFQVFADDPTSFEQKHAGQIMKVIQTNARKGGEIKQIVRSLV